MENFWNNLQASLPDILWRLAGIVLILVLGRLAQRIVRNVVARSYERRAKKLPEHRRQRMETASLVMQSVARYLIGFFVLCGIIGQLGLTSTMNSLLATAGIGGVALGIGAQSFVKDVVAGLFLLFEDQMAVGDYVTIAGITGTVEEVALRNTTIKGFRGELNVIPNGMVEVLTNFSRADYLALVEVQVSYEADARRAMDCMRQEAEDYAKEQDNVVDAPQVLGVTALNEDGITLRLVMRVKPLTHWATERALLERIKGRFQREGIEIPYPHMVVLPPREGGKGRDRAV